MRPHLVPVCGNARASGDGGSELERSGGAVIIAGEGRVGGILDGIAEKMLVFRW